MTEHEPTIEEIKAAFIHAKMGTTKSYSKYEYYERAFARMIAEVERAAAEKAWDEGVIKIYANAWVDLDPGVRPLENPYRRNEGETDGDGT